MAIKVKTTVKLKVLERLKSRGLPGLDRIASEVKKDIIKTVKTGVSPVLGYGRFEAYAAQRSPSGDGSRSSLKYPYSVQSKFPDKKLRPVNLTLDGTMLNAISARIKKNSFDLGIFTGKPKLMAETHNEGTQISKVPQRKFLPTASGELFIVSIQRRIKNLFSEALAKLID